MDADDIVAAIQGLEDTVSQALNSLDARLETMATTLGNMEQSLEYIKLSTDT